MAAVNGTRVNTKQWAGAAALALGAVLLLAPAPVAAQKSPLGQAAYGRAQDALGASRFADAARELETAVRYEPRFAFGWYLLASVSRRAGDCDRAVEAYRRYMELRPADADPFFGAGLCLQTVGDRAGASEYFRRYIERDARPSSIAFVEEARKHLAELDHAASAAAATPAPKPSPVLAEARDLRDHGKIDEAVARYRAASAADAKAAEPHVELGALLVEVHRNREAVEELRAGVRLNPLAEAGWYHLGFALRETGQTEEAVKAYRRYITLKPKDPDPRYGLGRALATLKRDDEALTAFRAYVTLEVRPTEKRWLKKARAEIARLEGGQEPGTADKPAAVGNAPASPPAPKPAKPAAAGATSPPPAKAERVEKAEKSDKSDKTEKPVEKTEKTDKAKVAPGAATAPPPALPAESQSAAAVQPPPARQPGE